MNKIKKELKIILFGVSLFALVLFLGFYLGSNSFGFDKFFNLKKDSSFEEEIQIENKQKETLNENKQKEIQIENKKEEMFCFKRFQEATEKKPYFVEEYIELQIKDGLVKGKIEGRHFGSDTIVPFFGILNGSIKEQKIEALFEYQIEGSFGQEMKLYEISEDFQKLFSQRFVLFEKDGILVPDLNQFVEEVLYNRINCK